jgi:hypothetical protein
MTTQPLVAQDVPERGQQTVYVATAQGYLLCSRRDGYVRWHVDLGRLAHIPAARSRTDGA